VDITVYLPDDIGKRANEADLPFSHLLRGAVETELARRDAIAETLGDGVEEHEVDLGDYAGVITGKLLGTLKDGDQFFLTDDGRVLTYDAHNRGVWAHEDPETELGKWLQDCPEDDEVVIADVMRSLGYRPRMRL
jgi:hypothetical protein